MDAPDNPIVKALRAARSDRGLTQSELARRAGLALRTYQRLEGGDPGAKLESLFKVLDALGLTLTPAAKSRPTLEQLQDLYGHEP
jgi:transcriptional regulator with XRE-family HTH domain